MTTPRPAPHPSEGAPTDGALGSVRILDLTDQRAIYGAKLLADLGATVIRIEPPEGDPLRQRGPRLATSEGSDHSLYYANYASNRRSVTVDLTTEDGRTQLRQLATSVDIIIDTGTLVAANIEVDSLLADHPALVIVSVSSFGPTGPWAGYLTTDLVTGALGGLVATTGDIDTQPLNTYGELNFGTTGAYAAIGALAALNHARETGEGQIVELAAHEAVPSALEHVLMWTWHNEDLPIAHDDVLPRRGSLHWSDAYEVMTARDGAIMVTITPDPMKQLAWLVEEGVEQDLLDPLYGDPENPRPMMMRMMEVLREWVADQNVEQFFFESQNRHFPYGWVLSPDRVAASPQLEARHWWADYHLDGATVRGPGAPYLLEDTPIPTTRTIEAPGASTADILAEIGWTD